MTELLQARIDLVDKHYEFGIMGFLQHWNAGHCCGKTADDNWDDVGFVTAALEDVRARLPGLFTN
jgi:hypothetical protein